MKRLIIAEKPTLAKLIVNSLPKEGFERKDGYYEGVHCVVTYAFGHLFQAYDVEDYPYMKEYAGKAWTLDILPFCPQNRTFSYKLITKKGKDGKRTTDPGILKQFNTIKALINRKDMEKIIHAGDADREGEILLRLVIRNANPSNKDVQRLWVREQTESEIRYGLMHLVPDSDYDDLSNEGFARSYTDWLDGINLTRYFSIKVNAPLGRPFRLGRVKCAMVREIYDRDKEIENFVPVPFLKLVSEEETNGIKIPFTSKKTFDVNDRDAAEKHALLLNCSPAVVSDIQKKKAEIHPGKLFSLTSLQNTLLKRYKMPLKTSYDAIQSVYDQGFITYPRTNTEYLGESEKSKVEGILGVFSKQGYKLLFKDKKSIFDSSKVESHSAIIPTYKVPTSLEGNEKLVYETVRDRFLAVFAADPCLVDRTTIIITIADEKFKLTGDILCQKGFTEYENVKVSEKQLPPLKTGDKVNIDFKIKEDETKPPKHYTAQTFNNFLLAPFKAQKDEGEESADEDEKSAETDDTELYRDILSGIEIGTVASRTDIIEGIIKNGYINEKNGVYTIAPAGQYLIETMEKLHIDMDKETTVKMSVVLKRVNKGELTINDAIDMCMEHLNSIFSYSAAVEVKDCVDAGAVQKVNKYGKTSVGICPVCGGEVYESPKTFMCENNKRDDNTCNFYLYKEDHYIKAVYGHNITTAVATKLLKSKKYTEKGKTVLLVVDNEKKSSSWKSESNGGSYGKGKSGGGYHKKWKNAVKTK